MHAIIWEFMERPGVAAFLLGLLTGVLVANVIIRSTF